MNDNINSTNLVSQDSKININGNMIPINQLQGFLSLIMPNLDINKQNKSNGFNINLNINFDLGNQNNSSNKPNINQLIEQNINTNNNLQKEKQVIIEVEDDTYYSNILPENEFVDIKTDNVKCYYQENKITDSNIIPLFKELNKTESKNLS
jgi:hypothetical protein